MMKKFLAALMVLMLAMTLTVFAFAADGGVASLALAKDNTVDYTALEEGDVITVYIVVPAIRGGTSAHVIYRPFGTAKAGLAVSAGNADLFAESYKITWDDDYLALNKAPTVLTNRSDASDATADFTTNDGTSLYFAHMAKTGTSEKNVMPPAIAPSEAWSDNVTISYSNGGDKFTGFVVYNANLDSANACVAVLEFKVKNASAETTTKITLTDTYTVGAATNAATVKTADVSVTVAAGCAHPEDKITNYEKTDSTCHSNGKETFHCELCGMDVENTLPLLPHSYEEGGSGIVERKNTTEPTCLDTGISYNFCTNDGCTYYDESSEQTVPANGHTFKKVTISTLTCSTPGEEFYYCEDCYVIADDTEYNDAPVNGETTTAIKADIVYNPADGKFYEKYEDDTFKREQNWKPYTVYKAPGHNIVSDGNGGYMCDRDICDGSDPFVMYVKDGGTGSGATSSDPTTFKAAMNFFSAADYPLDAECYVYLVGNVTLEPQVYDATYNAHTAVFEEHPHDVHITITTDPEKSGKATFTLPSTCPWYYLYGPTTFENLNIASDESRKPRYIAGRGFKLVLGEGLTMPSKGDDYYQSYVKETTAGMGVENLRISDAHIIAIAGIVREGGVLGSYEGFNPACYTTEMEVLSGSYWAIYHYSRGVTTTMDGCRAKITIGKVSSDSLLANSEKVVMNNCHSTILYVGKSQIKWDYRFAMQPTGGTGNVVDRLFFPGYSGSKVGDFYYGSGAANADVATNTYYYDDGTTSMENDTLTKATVIKHDKAVAAGYRVTFEIAPIPKWCVESYADAFGVEENGHFYGKDGKCTFCGVSECKYHRETEWVIVSEPDCMNPGSKYEQCTACFEVLATEDIPSNGTEHEIAWTFEGETPLAICTICGNAYNTAEGKDYSKIYVSNGGVSYGGFSPEVPLNDFDAAMKFAAMADGDATVYIVGSITFAENIEGHAKYYDFLEPEHDNTITIRGYLNTIGVLEFGGGLTMGTGEAGRMTYNLNGETVFEQVEFSGGGNSGNLYVCGRHNHLTFGEKVTADINRIGGSTTSSQLVVVGGCYDHQYGCSGGDNHITVSSGVFYQLIGGGVRKDCSNNIVIEILGDISAVEDVTFGGYGENVNDVKVIIDGSVLCNKGIAFGGKSGESKAGNVSIVLRSGTMISDAAGATVRYLGATNAGEKPTDRVDSLTVYYDPDMAASKILVNKISATSDKAKFTAAILTAANFCSETGTTHEEGTELEVVDSTCYSEGYRKIECAKCGETYREVIAKVDHNPAYDSTIAATCTSPALEKYICGTTGCGAVSYEVVDGSEKLDASIIGNHKLDDNGVCTVCNTSVVDICSHNYIASEITRSCGSGMKYVCDICNHSYVDITSENHNYGAFSVSVEPTESTPGVKARTCKGCGKVDTAILYSTDAIYNKAIATDESGNDAGLTVALSRLDKYERIAINSLLQDTSYGSEIKVAYNVEGDSITNVTYRIPVPAEYTDMSDVKVVIKDDTGKLHIMEFEIEQGYIVFTF